MSSERFVQPPQGRFAIGCASIFLGLPAVGTAVQLASAAPVWTPAPLAAFAVALALVYVWLNEETAVTLDERGLRLARTRVLLGVRLAEVVEWEIPLGKLTQAREVTTKTPSKNGGWNVRTVLQLPEGRTLDATALGGAEDAASAYSQLARALQTELGDAFERSTTT